MLTFSGRRCAVVAGACASLVFVALPVPAPWVPPDTLPCARLPPALLLLVTGWPVFCTTTSPIAGLGVTVCATAGCAFVDGASIPAELPERAGSPVEGARCANAGGWWSAGMVVVAGLLAPGCTICSQLSLFCWLPTHAAEQR